MLGGKVPSAALGRGHMFDSGDVDRIITETAVVAYVVGMLVGAGLTILVMVW